MRPFIVVLLASIAILPTAAQSPSYAVLEQQAELQYAEKSYARANDLYEQAAPLAPPEKRRWVAFRLADTAWRSDESARETAREELERLIRESGDTHDRIWAEAHESLGDLHWIDQRHRNQGEAPRHYLAALDWWAASEEIELARQRYLAIVFRMGDPDQARYYGEFYWTQSIPREVLVNAVAIAQSRDDRAQARFLLASHLLNSGAPADVERGLELLEEVIRDGRGTPYYDDALATAAQRYLQGVPRVRDDGRIEFAPDARRALELFRRITTEFKPAETRYYHNATRQIQLIVEPSVAVAVAGTFLPKSEQEVHVSARNVSAIEFTVTAVDLIRDLRFDPGKGNWQENINTEGRTPLRRWSVPTNDTGEHDLFTERVRIEPKLERGAYILRATGGGKSAQQLLLVTDANVIAHVGANRADVFVSDALSGAPVSDARVRVWQFERNAPPPLDGRTADSGLATVVLKPVHHQLLIVASAANGAQAFVQTWGGYYRGTEDEWRVYAFTDRPAYRPNETVKWKFIARVRDDDRWTTPANATLEYEIINPRGEKVANGRANLNEFGTFWSELTLTESMPLGAYMLRLRKAGAGEHEFVGHAQLFRLEEYKLPEFVVDVAPPAVDGKPKTFRLGERVEVAIEASYYFGGPVANATVEAVVFREPFARYWPLHRQYSWLWPRPPQHGATEVLRQTLRTDAAGRAILTIDTPRDGQDSIYRIEARVIDASRREVVGKGEIRVTRQRYTVMAQPQRYIVRPGDKVTIDFKAIDANDQPVQTTGNVRVIRRRWHETDYRDEELLKTTVTTDSKGEGTLTFQPPREGYYTIEWTSEDRESSETLRARDIVKAETSVWVSDTRSTDLGYRAGALEIIVDRDSFRAGEMASAMIVTPASGRWVFVTISGSTILDSQVLRLDGTVKLVQFRVDERHVPGFDITASSVFDRTLSTVAKRVVVPPVEHFIDVEVKTDREQYEPRHEGTVIVTTRDVDGNPVSAEVALSVSDEAVTAISRDPAGDPREFFFGQQRPYAMHVAASVQTQRYLMLVEKDDILIDERQLDALKKRGEMRFAAVGASVGGVVGGVVGGMPPPPPAAPVAEAITVTAQAAMKDEAMDMSARRERQEEAGTIDIQVRTDFSSTAFWQPDIRTGADGTAQVQVKFPEALTTWRATARAVTTATQVGMGSATARTSMPLLIRLQAPRFFVVGDQATVSGVINNNTGSAVDVDASLTAEGLSTGGVARGPRVSVPANGEARVDWVVSAERAGTAKLRVTAESGALGDAMEKTFTVFEHGIDKLIARSGKLRGDDAIVRLDLPRERRATDLSVHIQPSLAVMMVDALPYLIEFPYGCTEQTMSRFLPAAIVARTLATLGVARDPIPNLDRVTAAGIARLHDMQHGDGGWGWWKEGESDSFMTAYVVWGFAVAREGGLNVNNAVVERGAQFLEERLVQHENDPHMQTWMLHALAAWRKNVRSDSASRAFDNVWARRERLSSYSRALLALAAHDFGDSARASVLIRNLENGVKIDNAPDRSVLVPGSGANAAETMATAHWGEDGFWWRWYEGPVESTAFALRALVRIDPANKLIEPAMNWLVKNRRGAQWSNTRDTAISVLALNDYLIASGEAASNIRYELTVNGRVIGGDSTARRFTIDHELVRDANEIRIRRTAGTGPIYFAVEGRFVSLEEPVKAAGNELFVRREYFRLVPKPTLLKGVTYDRVPLLDHGTIQSGERVEVVVTIETKNDYEYLMFEDLKPAGLEAVELQSGTPLWATDTAKNRTAWVYQELRDRKVAMFIDHLAQGIWEIRYTLRAEVPGTFHALPLLGQAMYVPDIRANGAEVRLTVSE